MASKLEQLKAVHARIALWRDQGLDFRTIAEKLGLAGIEVDHSAVYRYCKKAGIPTDRVKPPELAHKNVSQSAMQAGAPHTNESDASLVTTDPRGPLRGKNELGTNSFAVPVEFSTPATIGSVEAGTTGPGRSDRPGSRSDLGPAPSTIASPNTDTPHPASPTPVSPTPASPTSDNDTHEVAALMVELGRINDRIEAAKTTGNRATLHSTLVEAKAWIESNLPRVSPTIQGFFRDGLRQFEPFLVATSDSAPTPLFAALQGGPMWPGDLHLLEFNGGTDPWMLRDACEGTLILGATGSGKTSGSGQTLARSFLMFGFGGLVLTAKQDEAQHWVTMAEKSGRTPQLCFVRPGLGLRFNFLDYQASLPESSGGSVESVVELLLSILESFSKVTRGGGGGGENGSFWVNTSRQILRNLVRILRASKARLTFSAIREFITQAPRSLDEVKANTWRESKTFGTLIQRAEAFVQSSSNRGDVVEALRYWTSEFPNLNDRTRSIVVMDLTATIDLFFDPTLEELFCTDTTITPDAVLDGAVIVVDLPVERWHSVGRMAQLIWKQVFQLSIRRRSDPDDDSRRPVFLWIDEFQNFLSDSDANFQATARSARCASVLLTQSIPGLFIQAGAMLPRERVASLTSNLNTKVFHANADPATNAWASEQIGKSLQYRASVSDAGESRSVWSSSLSELMKGSSRSKTNLSPVMDLEVQPAEFTKLRTGSKRFNHQVDAVILKSGMRFSNGKQFIRVTFSQEI